MAENDNVQPAVTEEDADKNKPDITIDTTVPDVQVKTPESKLPIGKLGDNSNTGR